MNMMFPFSSGTPSVEMDSFALIYLVAVVIGLLVWIGCIVASIIIMKRKGRSAGLGFVFGFFLGWIGLIIVLCKKKVDNNAKYYYKSNAFNQHERFR